MCERGHWASHNEGHDGPNIRPRQLRNREVPWEGSQRSKLMSRRTERPYQVDGTDELAPHSAVRCSVPEINGPVVPQEFTSLLRETCGPGLSAKAGLAASNGGQAGTGVSRGRSTESNEPETKKPEGLTTREGLNLAGRHDHRWSCSRCDEADWPSTGQRSSWQRKNGCSIRQDCQEPPDADPHVRWCGRREGKPSRRPDWAVRGQVAEPWRSPLLLKLGCEQPDILLACANKRISLPCGVPILASATSCLWPQEEEERIRVLLQGYGVVLLQSGPINCNLCGRPKALVS